MNKKEKRVFEAISKAYSDKAVQNDPELSRMLLTAAKSLQNGKEHKLVCMKLSNGISNYLFTHKFKAPDVLNALYNDIIKEAESYRGTASIGIWLNNN